MTLYVDGAAVATRGGVRTHPERFGLAGAGIRIGSNPGRAVRAAYRAPFPFTGGTIAQGIIDISGAPYLDVERELGRAFARD